MSVKNHRKLRYTGVPDSTLEELSTDSSGQTETIELSTPPLEYSLNPAIEEQPYSEYTLQIDAPGYEPVSIAGVEILPTVKAIQNVTLRPSDTTSPSEEVFVIPAHTLYNYPATSGSRSATSMTPSHQSSMNSFPTTCHAPACANRS